MSRFSTAELDYLLGERHLGRLATVDAAGQPHVVPVGWRYNADLDTIDISGNELAATRKFRNVLANPRAAFVVDDVRPPWRPRAVAVRGRAQALHSVAAEVEGDAAQPRALIRLTPDKIVSWGLDG